MIGVVVQGRDARAVVEAIVRAESLGIPAVWMTMGGVSADSTDVFAAAAVQTQAVKFGTSIIPTWPRHPIAIAQQAVALASLAPGRFRLGIGPSHQPTIERLLGVEFREPLRHLKEYLQVLSSLLHGGSVDFEGKYVSAHGQIPAPVDVPVMASALRRGSFLACGELADGAISWVAPWDYLRDTALPALEEGAAKAGRQAPPLIAHVPVSVDESADEVHQAAREQIGFYSRVPFYAAMYEAAGFPDVSQGPSDPLLDALVVHGDERTVVQRLQQIKSEGAGEIIAHPILVGTDRQESLTRALTAIAHAN